MKLALLAVALAVSIAGCIGGSTPQPLPEAPASIPVVGPAPGLRVEAADCTEGGGHSTYNKDELAGLVPEPWVLADVTEDVGDPLLLSLGRVNMGQGLAGIYHATFQCGSFTLGGEPREGLLGGFVGVRVEPPPFDDGQAQKHYLITVLSSGDQDVAGALHEAGFHTGSAQGLIEWVGPVFHQVLQDTDHGRYEVHFLAKEQGAKQDGLTRLWMMHEGDDGLFRPVSVDMQDVGGQHFIAEAGNGGFSHLFTDDHPPIPKPLGAGGNVAGIAYTGFTRTLTLGPSPNVAYEEAWQH